MQRLFPDPLDNPNDDALASAYAWPTDSKDSDSNATNGTDSNATDISDTDSAGTGTGTGADSDGTGAGPGARVYVRANMVGSLDGRAALAGRSGGLSNPADQHLLELLRDLADVVLLGAGTARAEHYPGVRPDEARRARWGLGAPPPVAVVTGHALDPELPLFTDTITKPIVLTTAQAATTMTDLPASVIVAGDERLDLRLGLRELGRLGLHRVHCEGGPSLLAQLLEADLVDELCLTSSPLLLGGGTLGLLADRELSTPRRWQLAGVHRDTDHLFSHYRRAP